jgi:hypothetical protein
MTPAANGAGGSASGGLDGLADAPRPGRPRKFAARVVAAVKALACELPA